MLQLSQISVLKIGLAVCFALLAVLIYAAYKPQDQEDEAIPLIIGYWNRTIKHPEKPFKSMVIGVNSNLDIIVPGAALLKVLGVSPGDRKSHTSLSSLNQLQETFSIYLSRGSAAERPFLNEDLYREIIKVAETLDEAQYFIGGNAALIAVKASKLFPELKIHFVGPVGPLLKKLMPSNIEINPRCITPQDEVHLIMEYKIGEKWGTSVAPVANRFVTSFDETNAKMLMLEPLFDSIKSSGFDLMVLSGLHMLDAQSPEFMSERLDKLVSMLQNVPLKTVSHLEFASMTNQNYVQEIFNKILPNMNSLGLNEQELVFASKACGGPHGNMFDKDNHGQPDIEKISDILLWVMKTFGCSSDNNSSRLTRIHFHSLTYHIMAVVPSAWSNIDNAVAAGAQMAGLQACDTPELQPQLFKLIFPKKFMFFSGESEHNFNAEEPTVNWERDGIRFFLSPVLVCKHPVKTVGLGDAISATGLMFAQYKSLF